MIEDRDLEALARQLGQHRAERIDPEETAAAVVGRLRSARAGDHWWSRPAFRRLAAAAVLVVAAGLFFARSGLDRTLGQAVASAPLGLDELAAGELIQLIDSLDVDRPVHELVPPTLESLSERQLELLLQNMEGEG